LALQRQGHFAWAAAEYELVGDAGWSRSAIRARERHAEMLHDQGRNLEAAEVLNKVLSPEDKRLQRIIEGGRANLGGLRARMNYFRACHWAEQGDDDKHRRYLDEALEAKPGELDTLIACYQLPKKTPEFHRKIVGLIEQAVEGLQEQIDATDDDYTLAHLYNQYAWLAGNTEGNVDLTLEYAHKAVELVPDSGAYLDTLAHVYYGKGDHGNAVKYQLQALELDPHSGLLQQKLAVFRKALQQQKQAAQEERDQ
jgi:tetratricopeptide (TPR) repeat protein